MKRIVHWLAAVLGLCIAASAGAQILIGQTSGFSGPVAAGVKEVSDGAKLYIDATNAKGGVNGQSRHSAESPFRALLKAAGYDA